MENPDILPPDKVIIHGLAFYWMNYALGYFNKSAIPGAILVILSCILAYFTVRFVIELLKDIVKELGCIFGDNTSKPSNMG